MKPTATDSRPGFRFQIISALILLALAPVAMYLIGKEEELRRTYAILSIYIFVVAGYTIIMIRPRVVVALSWLILVAAYVSNHQGIIGSGLLYTAASGIVALIAALILTDHTPSRTRKFGATAPR